MRGRNTTVISMRIPDSTYLEIKAKADREGLNVADYLKKQLGIQSDGSIIDKMITE